MRDDGGRESAKSLNTTITEIMAHLEDESDRPSPGPGKLRPFLHEKIGDLAERWFRRGFNRGHRECYRSFKTDGIVPGKLEYECSRRLSPGQERELILKSTIKKPKATSRRKRG